jgi:hypothetical protein
MEESDYKTIEKKPESPATMDYPSVD